MHYVHTDIIEVGTYLTGPGFLDLLVKTETYRIATQVDDSKPPATTGAPRIGFSVLLESPEICMPSEPGSRKGLMLYPGHIRAENEFVLRSEDGQDVLREVIRIDIDRLRVDAQQADSLHALMGEGWDLNVH